VNVTSSCALLNQASQSYKNETDNNQSWEEDYMPNISTNIIEKQAGGYSTYRSRENRKDRSSFLAVSVTQPY